MNLKEKIKHETKAILNEIIAIRRHLHQYPELSFQEFETSAYIQQQLTNFGIEYHSGIVNTGIVALISPDRPVDKWIGLRADMDALPMKEMNDISYKSVHSGIMHACGHDVHTAMLLGAAKVIASFKNELNVGVKCIFQPGEEKLPGGAKLMIEAGVLNDPPIEEIYALHVFPELEVGKIGFRPGMYMASCDEIRMTVKGKGGHGAMPHQNIDPILIASHLIVTLQQIVSRHCPPEIPSVLSFGRIEGLGATNVIPDEVKIEGTFRTMNEHWRALAHEKIKALSEDLVKSMGGTIDVKIDVGYPYLENDPHLTVQAREKATQLLGEENCVDLPLRMTGEDFAYFSQKIPATFIRIGVRNEKKGIVHAVHNTRFNIDEASIEVGILTLLAQVFEL